MLLLVRGYYDPIELDLEPDECRQMAHNLLGQPVFNDNFEAIGITVAAWYDEKDELIIYDADIVEVDYDID
jgi:hypothetical protein